MTSVSAASSASSGEFSEQPITSARCTNGVCMRSLEKAASAPQWDCRCLTLSFPRGCTQRQALASAPMASPRCRIAQGGLLPISHALRGAGESDAARHGEPQCARHSPNAQAVDGFLRRRRASSGCGSGRPAAVWPFDQSCERQERDLRAFAKRADHKIVAVFKETGVRW